MYGRPTGSHPETDMWEITPDESASIRQPHWHRQLDVKRPYRRCAGGQVPEAVGCAGQSRLIVLTPYIHRLRVSGIRTSTLVSFDGGPPSRRCSDFSFG